MNNKLFNFFFHFDSVVLVVKLVKRIEEAMVYHDAKFSLIVNFFDFLYKDKEGRFGTNHEILSFILYFKIGVWLTGKEASSCCKADLIL